MKSSMIVSVMHISILSSYILNHLRVTHHITAYDSQLLMLNIMNVRIVKIENALIPEL